MRSFSLNHQKPCPTLTRDYVVLPFGSRLNADIAEAGRGDSIFFSDAEGEYTITSVARIAINTRLADELCYMRYGVGMRKVYMRWTSTAIYYGYGKDAISKEECLIVFFVPSTRK